MEIWNEVLLESILRYLGQTVTVFTTSGGLSGSGFTGVLISADCRVIRLLCDVGAPPACPVGSACTNVGTPYGIGAFSGGYGACGGFGGFAGNPLGAIAVIPTDAVACFTHNAI